MISDDLKRKIESCTTKKQILALLKANNLTIKKDTSSNAGFSVWLDDQTRIYKPYGQKHMKVQSWNKIDVFYSGIPTFFATDSCF